MDCLFRQEWHRQLRNLVFPIEAWGGRRGYYWELFVGVCCLILQSWPFFRPKIVIFHTCFQTWASEPRNIVGPKSKFKIKIVAQFLAHKPVNFALLTDNYIVSFSKIIEALILNVNRATTKQLSGTFEKRPPGLQKLVITSIRKSTKRFRKIYQFYNLHV